MICLVMVQNLGKGILSRGEGAAQGGEVSLDILSGGQMNILGKMFPWDIWRLGETMPDKTKE